jgi:acylphosphatase
MILMTEMLRLTAYISGLTGYAKNQEDGRVKVVAEGETIDLEILLRSLDIKNTLIHVVDIKNEYSSATGEFEGFFKVVSGGGETDQRLDVAAERLTELVTVNREILMELKANRQELKETRGDIRDSRDAIVSEIRCSRDAIVGEVGDARDSIVDEIGVLRADLKESVQDRLMRIESDVAQIKAKIGF